MFKKKSFFLGLTIVFILVLSACGNSEAGNAEVEDAQKVDVVATNFQFDKAEYVVKAGEPVSITLTSDEGGHGINIDEFDVNIAAPGGTATFTPDKAGEYKIYCNTFCGTGHETMTATLVVE